MLKIIIFYINPQIEAACITINYNNIEISYDHNKLGNITTKTLIYKTHTHILCVIFVFNYNNIQGVIRQLY